MKILSISSILPIPEVIKDNDFVFQTYKYYNQLYKKDTVVIIKPVQYDLSFIRTIRKSTNLFKLGRIFYRNIYDFQVVVLPFFSSKRFRNIHSIITRSIFYLNKKRISSLFSTHNFNVIHAQYIFPDGLLAKILHRKYNIPYFVTTHNELLYFKHFLSRKISLNILKNASEVLPLNHTNYLYYKSIGVKNIEILPLGFKKSFLREQRMTTSNTVSILTTAELKKLKNIDKVLYAIRTIVPSYKTHYTIIGTGAEKEALLRLTDDLDLNKYVTFIDHIPHDQLTDEMYKHDIFIMPSYFETFGRVYFEAMAMGIPVICARNSGIYGLFKDFEEGISVNHENINEIAESLIFLISNTKERLRIGRKGQELVKDYTWEKIVNILHSKYIKALS